MLTNLILGVDAGNYMAKIAGPYGIDSYKTNICNWFERDVKETFGADDMEFKINGRKGYAGSIAAAEDEFGDGTTYGDTKAHEDTKIRVLLGIYRYIEKYAPGTTTISIVTGQPVTAHKEEEKKKIIEMLKDFHYFKVNGKDVKFVIEDVKVTPEGAGAFWSNPCDGSMKIIDVGSGTVNMVSILDKKFVHKSSGTLGVGMETMKNRHDVDGMARAIFQHGTKLKWKKHDRVVLCGGATEKMMEPLKNYFPEITLNHAILKTSNPIPVNPGFANAVGFYNLARWSYK